jgi:hypothetical protein
MIGRVVRTAISLVSAMRPLLFHLQEHEFTLPIIRTYLSGEICKSIHFGLPTRARPQYRRRFPEYMATTDLGRWHVFDTENLATFIRMNSGGSRLLVWQTSAGRGRRRREVARWSQRRGGKVLRAQPPAWRGLGCRAKRYGRAAARPERMTEASPARPATGPMPADSSSKLPLRNAGQSCSAWADQKSDAPDDDRRVGGRSVVRARFDAFLHGRFRRCHRRPPLSSDALTREAKRSGRRRDPAEIGRQPGPAHDRPSAARFAFQQHVMNPCRPAVI